MHHNVILKDAITCHHKAKTMNRLLFRIYKKMLAQLLVYTNQLIVKLPRGRFAASLALQQIWDTTYKFKIDNRYLYFHIPNWLTFFRAKTLLTKEPETIAWLNKIKVNSIVYDIGANVGVYSIYAAAIRSCQVLSFEPSFLNLELLFRNIQTNNVHNNITIVPISLSNKSQIENFYMQEGDNIWGGAHNSSGSNKSQDGTEMQNFKTSSQIALTLDDLVDIFNLPAPNHIKIDVDGLEDKVLQGGLKTLGNVKSILVEIDLKNTVQNREIQQVLGELGFVKLSSLDRIDLEENQIWVKSGWDN
jgi:FkbM family methyltransferase